MVGCEVYFIKRAGFTECPGNGAVRKFAPFFDEVGQAELRSCENIRFKTLTKCLATNLHPPKIGACADILHQVWNFWKRTPFAVRRNGGVARWFCGFFIPPCVCV